MRTVSRLTGLVAAVAVATAGCSDTSTAPTGGPVAAKVKEGKSKAGRDTPSGSAVMPKEPGR